MPVSYDPQPAENEIECARCGAIVHIEVTRCPNCGVSLYEPEEGDPAPAWQPRLARRRRTAQSSNRLTAWLRGLYHRLFNKPYPVEYLFGAAINQAELFDALLLKTAGDREAAERLVEVERQKKPNGSRAGWIQAAIERLK